MKNAKNKVSYKTPGKRNPFQDVLSDAGRRAKNRMAEKNSENDLRAALNFPKDQKGKPISAHLVKKIAANQLRMSGGHSDALDFEFAAELFLQKLTFQVWGHATTVSSLWKSFLEVVGEADPDHARQFAHTRERDFRYCALGHVHRLKLEYDQQPDAIQTIEIWVGKHGTTLIGVQRDGQKRIMPHDQRPDGPMLWHAGSKLSALMAPGDFDRLMKMGVQKFIAAYETGKFKLAPRPLELLTEDTFLNVAPPTASDLEEIRQMLAWNTSIRGYKPKSKHGLKT